MKNKDTNNKKWNLSNANLGSLNLYSIKEQWMTDIPNFSEYPHKHHENNETK